MKHVWMAGVLSVCLLNCAQGNLPQEMPLLYGWGEAVAVPTVKSKAALPAATHALPEIGKINMINADILRDAQKKPENYRHLLVRVTGYNAYFTSIGKELQDEIIARESHRM